MAYPQWIAAIALVGCAGWSDWRTRRIPNRLTLPAILVGLSMNMLLAGWAGLVSAAAGAALMLVVLLPLVWLRALGAGDWKLLGALGALLGPLPALWVLLATTLIAGLMAVAQVICAKRVRATMKNLWGLVRGLLVYGLAPHPTIRLGNPRQLTLPYGVAVAGATVVCFAVSLALG